MSHISTFICAISGEPLAIDSSIVVTPSGHICSKSLLLSKLTENDGIDPFTSQPLNENELIPINTSSSSSSSFSTITAPKLSTHSSFSSLLSSINSEYEALVLELFDTRKVLQETRKELSQALYQNDAAVRVIARVTMERDDARQKLASFDASNVTAQQQPKPTADVVEDEEQQPNSKKQKTEAEDAAVTKDDIEVLKSEWKKLSKSRKKRPIPDNYVTTTEMESFKEVQKLSLHKSTAKPGITTMKGLGDFICTAGYDKHVIVYDKKVTTTTLEIHFYLLFYIKKLKHFFVRVAVLPQL